ncbi:MAG: ATPase, T2SS/T4P/T4SS family, partial [Candidatus Magasanikiibacteriota bacterium]
MVEKLTDEKIKDILVGETYLSKKDIEQVEQGMKETGMGLAEYLVEGGFITKEILGQALAEYYNTVYINLSREKIDQDLLQKVPELVARSKGVVAFSTDEKGVKVAMLNPADIETIHVLEKLLGNSIEPFFMTEQDFEEAMSNYKLGLKDEFNKILVDLQKFGLNKEKSDDVVVSMVDTLLKYGHQNRASDIHIEPYNEKLMVRFRIDGIMHDVLEVPKEFSEVVLTRIKILSKMRTDEHRAAQDGKLRFKSESETVDVRVSVVPTTLGENVVMRILSARSRSFGLSDLGLSNSEMKKVQNAIKHPHGMFLVTGPTGSGKTTTLYAILKLLNRRDVNIATIEDPVEYDMEGITQIQV